MPHDPILIRSDVVTTPGLHDLVVEQKYEALAGPNGEMLADPHRAQDEAVAANVMAWLLREYRGYPWGVVVDSKQGIIKFNIPILMGFNMFWVINLHTTDVIEGLAAGAGQILERYGLSRTRFSLGEFLEARAQHSILVNPARKVPH